MNVTIREGTNEDAEAILAFLDLACRQSDYLTFGPGEFDKTLEDERAFLNEASQADNQICLVALIEDRVVASLHYGTGTRPRLRHTGEFGVSVLKECWGKGIGSKLVDRMIEWARATGFVRKINLRVRTDNPRAISLYEKKGFVNEGTITRDMCVDGVFYDSHCMGLQID